MAVGDNLKVASASLRRAIEDNKREIDALRKKKDENRKQQAIVIAQLTRDMGQRTADLHRVDDSAEKSRAQTDIQDIDRQIAVVRREITDEDQRIDNDIKSRESLNTNLDSQARALESQAGMATGLI